MTVAILATTTILLTTATRAAASSATTDTLHAPFLGADDVTDGTAKDDENN